MASGVKMFFLAVMWLTNLVVLMLFVIAGNATFQMMKYLQTLGIPMVINYDIIQPIFPAFFFFALVTMIAISYKIYEEIASDTVYQPGY